MGRANLRAAALSPYYPELNLYDTVLHGSAPLDLITEKLRRTYRRSVRLVGGYWTAQAEYNGPEDEKLELFTNGLFRELRETFGGSELWRGFIGRMELTRGGMVFVRDLMQTANAVKLIYSRIGDNQFTNGSGESGAWASHNSGATAQSTAWVTEGAYSTRITATATDQGATIQSGISVTAGIGYEVRCSVNVVSGEWRLGIYRDDTGELLASATADDTGDAVLWCSLSEDENFTGAVSVRLTSTDGAGEVYGDAAVFQESPRRAETQWYLNEDAADVYGRIESIPLRSGMSDDDAQGEAQQLLAAQAWPRTQPPQQMTAAFDDSIEHRALNPLLPQVRSEPKNDGSFTLKVMFFGYVFTLRNKHSTITGTAAKSTHVTNVVSASEFIQPGTIETNASEFKIDERAPLRQWQILRALIQAGDAAGTRYVGGVRARRQFDYGPAPTAIAYRYRDETIFDVNDAPVEPWLVEPGIFRLDEMPIGPGDVGGVVANDPRCVWVDEVEYEMASGRVTLRQAVSDNAA